MIVPGYELAVFLVGSPSYTFESAASSIARVAESFELGEAVILHSRFARQEAERLRAFARRVFALDPKLEEQPSDLRSALARAQQLLRGRRSIAVPTSGSLLGAVALSIAASIEQSDIAHVLFPFGPWTGLFYPFTPRYLQPIQLLGSAPPPRQPKLDGVAAREYLESELRGWPRLRRRIAEVCLELNLSLNQAWVNDTSTPPLFVELSDKLEDNTVRVDLVLRTFTESVNVATLRELKDRREAKLESFRVQAFPPPDVKMFAELSRRILTALARRACKPPEWLYRFLGFNVLDLDPHGRYVVDTNLVYFGLHNHARPGGPSILLPYCTHAEILSKVAESKGACKELEAEILLMAYEALEAHAARIPSAPSRCDVSVPSIEPELLKGSTILTGDRRAFELWSRLALAKYTRLRHVSHTDFRSADESEAHYAAIQLAAIVRELASSSRRAEE